MSGAMRGSTGPVVDEQGEAGLATTDEGDVAAYSHSVRASSSAARRKAIVAAVSASFASVWSERWASAQAIGGCR